MANLAKHNFNASMRLLKKVEATCATLPALSELRTLSELTARARIVRSALNARSLFESLHKRVAGLNAALADFEQRKRRIAAGLPATTCPASTHPGPASKDCAGRDFPKTQSSESLSALNG